MGIAPFMCICEHRVFRKSHNIKQLNDPHAAIFKVFVPIYYFVAVRLNKLFQLESLWVLLPCDMLDVGMG